MHSRRPVALAGLLLSLPLLGACGFDYETDKINTISAGVNDRDGSIDVLGAVIIAGADGSGVFATTFTNNSRTEPASFVSLDATEQVSPTAEVAAVEIPSGGIVNLFRDGGVPVQGDFGAGDFVEVRLGFDNGQTNTVEIPVVPPCHQYDPEREEMAGIELPEVTEEETVEETVADVETADGEETEEHSETLPGVYSCELPANDGQFEHGHGGGE